jgi:hypothetical protein
MNATDLVGYLMGRRSAIANVWGCPTLAFLGPMVLANAALLFTYNTADVSHQVLLVCVPFITSIMVIVWVHIIAPYADSAHKRAAGERQSAYWRLLQLTWLTFVWSEIAFLPFEVFLSKYWAIRIIPIARIVGFLVQSALVLRVLSVITGRSIVFLGFRVAPIAATQTFAIAAVPPYPDLTLCTRLNHPQSDFWIVGALALIVASALMLAWLGALFLRLGPGENASWLALAPTRPSRVALAPICTATILVICSWVALFSWAQPRQQLKCVAEQRADKGDWNAAIEIMASHGQSAFPKLWDPPPHLEFHGSRSGVLDALEVIVKDDVHGWVRSVYVYKLRQYVGASSRFLPEFYFSGACRAIDLRRVTELLERIDEGSQIANDYVPRIQLLLNEDRGRLRETERQLLEKWVQLSKRESLNHL